MEIEEIAELCKQAALRGEHVKLRLPVDWSRPTGVPFPAVRPKVADQDDGTALWYWTPHAMVMWIFDLNKPAKEQV